MAYVILFSLSLSSKSSIALSIYLYVFQPCICGISMHKKLKTFFLLLILILACLHLTAQKLKFEYLTVKDGLPQNKVRSIIKDKYGFTWIGTWNGFCRYDGYKFKIYNTIPGDSTSITNNRIHYIYKDRDANLWITTFDSYVCRYNYQTDNFTRFRPTQLSKSIRDSTNRLGNLRAFETLGQELRRQIGEFHLSPSGEHIVNLIRLSYRLSQTHICAI